ncbi:MAG: S46 family peptidase [Flavobacteriales bacterium]|nr:S46 family peptidase [Flavobacteriales bacterium]
MKHLIKLCVAAVLMFPTFAKANEGMWLVSLLNKMNEAEMRGMGLNLTAEEIYSINKASLKDAIVRLNYGMCTGEVVSEKSLIFTNHHCGYDAIRTLSTVEKNLLRDGFCAKSFAEELPIPDFKIQFLVRIDDVTKQIMDAIPNGTSEAERAKLVAAKTKELINANNEGGKYEVELKSFYYGNEYYLMVYQTFSDIRLVGNPPESVGKYGGDTDNWMWPRHTGDFSMLRIYADKDNNPAAYSKDNVPYKPKHFLPVNIDGVEEGDFSMIMGFPGRTSRYLTSYGVQQAVDVRNPALISCLGTKLESWKTMMDADPAVDLMYAAKYASTANGWKYYIGQTRGLKRLNVKGDKEAIEKAFSTWANANDSRKQKYGQSLGMVKEYYDGWNPYVLKSTYAGLCGIGGAEFAGFAFGMGPELRAFAEEKDAAKRDEMKKALMGEIDAFFKEYNAGADKLVFVNLSNLYREQMKGADRATWHAVVDSKFKGNVNMYAEKLFATSIFTDKNRLMAFLEKPSTKVLDKDLAIQAANSMKEQSDSYAAFNQQEKFNIGMRQFVAGLREMNPDKAYAPDANSTMRLTYGLVDDYKAADAVHYDYYTTTVGILEKRDDSNPEFVVPQKLADLINAKDFGKYAPKGKDLVTCFLTTHDITGGNSGSPVIDGDGNLIGIAFDGNWEAMSGDIAFEKNMQRTISVDIRYVLFTVEKLMGGKNIVDELKYAKKKPKPAVAPATESSSVAPAPAGPQATPGPAVTPGPGGRPSTAADNKARMEEQRKKAEEEAKVKKAEFEKKKAESDKKKAEAAVKAKAANDKAKAPVKAAEKAPAKK